MASLRVTMDAVAFLANAESSAGIWGVWRKTIPGSVPFQVRSACSSTMRMVVSLIFCSCSGLCWIRMQSAPFPRVFQGTFGFSRIRLG